MNEQPTSDQHRDPTWQLVEVLFDEIISLPAADRAERLKRVAREKPAAYRELLNLLAADQRTAGVLDVPLGIAARRLLTGDATDAPSLLLATGTRIGAYEVERKLGEGGMGVVYLAHRADGAYEQQVALKVLRGDLPEWFADRFKRERKILARLQHPGIARLIDAGNTPDGMLYFVMDYVDGRPLTDWVHSQCPSIKARLALFLEVLDTVQFAHRNLVIHCDLKPGNILVDRDGRARLLDFGIARLLAEPANDEQPSGAAFALTPQYAAPELLWGEAPTVASEVYSLGAILYELLSGQKPRTGRTNPTTVLDFVLADVVPLDRLQNLNQRQQRELHGDLSAIVHKAMQPDPTHRYPTVDAFAEDIRRHLAHLPVNARQAGRFYRARKFLRRHRFGVAAASLIVLVTTVGFVTTAWQSHWRAIEAHKAEEVKKFALNLFSGMDPARALGQEITARQLVEEGAARIEHEFADQPEVRAEIMTFLADLFDKLGEQQRALELIEKAVATLSLSAPKPLADALQVRGRIRISSNQIDEGSADINRALELHTRYRNVLAAAEDHDQLAIAAQQRGDMDTARQHAETALELRLATLGTDNDETASSYNNLGVIARNTGDLESAERFHKTALEIRRKVLPAIHPSTALSLNNLGALMLSQGRYQDAEHYFHEALDQHIALYGEDHPLTVTARNNIGVAELRRGRFKQARTQLDRVLDYWRETAGIDHPNALVTRFNLAAVAAGLGDFTAAEQEWKRLLDIWREQFGDDHYATAAAEFALGNIALELGRLNEAENWMTASLEHRRAAFGESHPYVAESMRGLAQLALARGDSESAGQWLANAIEIQHNTLPETHPSNALAKLIHGRLLVDQGLHEQAAIELENALNLLEDQMDRNAPEIVRGRFDLARARISLGQATTATEDLFELRDSTAVRFGEDAWQTAIVECWLAQALANEGALDRLGPIAMHAERTLSVYEPVDLVEIRRGLQLLAHLEPAHK
ncbi:MAG: hypothetical protein Kow0020_05780 [Wenzhouxiangellaceae bacterium]